MKWIICIKRFGGVLAGLALLMFYLAFSIMVQAGNDESKGLDMVFLQAFSPQQQAQLRDAVSAADFDGALSAELVSALKGEGGDRELMLKLLPLAKQYALPPISNFYVGAVSQGGSGALYLVQCIELLAYIKSAQNAQSKALLAGNVDTLSKAATPLWAFWALPEGRARKWPSALLHFFEIGPLLRQKCASHMTIF